MVRDEVESQVDAMFTDIPQVETSDDDDDSDAVNTGSRRKRQKTTASRPSMHLTSPSDDYVSTHVDSQPAPKPTVVSGPSSVVDESEDDTYGGQRGRTFAKKHRKRLQAVASGTNTPDLSEVRFSTRRGAKVTNYNEDDGLNLSEEDTENLTPSYWTYTEDTGWAIDVVLNHRLKEGAGMLPATIEYEHSR